MRKKLTLEEWVALQLPTPEEYKAAGYEDIARRLMREQAKRKPAPTKSKVRYFYQRGKGY